MSVDRRTRQFDCTIYSASGEPGSRVRTLMVHSAPGWRVSGHSRIAASPAQRFPCDRSVRHSDQHLSLSRRHDEPVLPAFSVPSGQRRRTVGSRRCRPDTNSIPLATIEIPGLPHLLFFKYNEPPISVLFTYVAYTAHSVKGPHALNRRIVGMRLSSCRPHTVSTREYDEAMLRAED